MLLGVFGVFALIAYVSLELLDHPARQAFVGYLSVASLISMFASPLLIIVGLLVILSRSHSLICHCNFDLPLFYLLEFGDQDEECGVHAFLSFTCNLLDEHVILCVWDAIA